MIYDEPVMRPLGDCYLAVEFGDEASLVLSFRSLALKRALDRMAIRGVIETYVTPTMAAVVFDREQLTHERLAAEVRVALADLRWDDPMASRRFTLPIWYDDPWTAECAEQHGVENNMRFVAAVNDMTVDEAIAWHSSTDYWIVAVSFVPGCNLHYPLDPRVRLSAPKYTNPRATTPARTVALGGVGTSHYSLESPGGYQMLGRLAVDIYQPEPRAPVFSPSGVLFRPGDRIRYRPVIGPEYEEIQAAVNDGTYEYDVREDEFDVRAYVASGAAVSGGAPGTERDGQEVGR
jgi:urea carboxylase